jgi:hypothetical protein
MIQFGGSQLNVPSCVLSKVVCSTPDLVHAYQNTDQEAAKNRGGTQKIGSLTP